MTTPGIKVVRAFVCICKGIFLMQVLFHTILYLEYIHTCIDTYIHRYSHIIYIHYLREEYYKEFYLI